MRSARGIPYVSLVFAVCLQIVDSKVFTEWGRVEPITVPFVIGGSIVDVRGRYPWHVAVFYSGKYRGGGSIISGQHILTVTHLTFESGKPINPAHLIIKAGTITLSAGDSTDYQVDEIIRYPGYNETNLSNDICLLKIKTEIIFNKFIRPVRLWENSNTANTASKDESRPQIVVGFGLTENYVQSDVLKRATYFHVNSEKCGKNVPNFKATLKDNYNFCAMGVNSTICKGDSGGGLVYYSRLGKVYYLRGLVSQGYWQGETCSSVKEALFTDVVHYIKWIEKNSLPTMYNLLGNPGCDNFIENQKSSITLPALANLKYSFRTSLYISDCQGLLITKKHVLTQVDCVTSNNVRKLHAVELGSSVINGILEETQQYGIHSVEKENELAIIILAGEVESIAPVCIPTRPEFGAPAVLFWERKAKHPKHTQHHNATLSNGNLESMQELIRVQIDSDRDGRRMGSTPLLYTISDESGEHVYLRALEKCSIQECSNSSSFVDILKYRSWISEVTREYIDDNMIVPPLEQ